MNTNKKKVLIIGGGTAGLTIANNIQEHFDVVVIEKNQYKKYPLLYKIPLMIGFIFRNKKSKYISKRDFILSDNRHIPFFESNLLGGASIINGCVHMLGSKVRWQSILKKFNTDYDDLLDSYNKLFSLNQASKNRINLTLASQNVIDKAFIETLNRNKIPAGNMNFSDNEACGPILNTIKKYFRTSVLSLIDNQLFKVILGENVENIVFDTSGKVTGVQTRQRTINTDYVILSCGVIGTCDFLLREKYKKGDVQGGFFKNLVVGNDIQDHTNLRINVITNKRIGSLNEISNSFYERLSLLFRHFSGKSTLMKGTGATSAAHLDIDNDGEIDTRIQIVQFTESGRHGSDGKFFGNTPGFSISITVINPESRGEVTIKDTNNVVNPMFLSSKKDIDLLKAALKYCLKLLHSKPISDHILKIESEYIIENDPEKYINDNIFSGHHLIGGAHDAVDFNFEVHNTKGLYVCDASVFKEYAASNIHSSVVLLADIFSKKFISRNLVK